jgi:hypothetical protein
MEGEPGRKIADRFLELFLLLIIAASPVAACTLDKFLLLWPLGDSVLLVSSFFRRIRLHRLIEGY